MVRKTFSILVLGGFVAIIGWAHLENEKDIKSIARENGFDDERTAAYRACDGHMSGKTLTTGGVTYSQVPDEICVCHSRNMQAVFKSGEYSSHRNVIDYLTDEDTPKPLNQSDLKAPAHAELDFMRLAISVGQCVESYQLETDRRNREDLQRVCSELEARGASRRPSQCADLAAGRL